MSSSLSTPYKTSSPSTTGGHAPLISRRGQTSSAEPLSPARQSQEGQSPRPSTLGPLPAKSGPVGLPGPAGHRRTVPPPADTSQHCGPISSAKFFLCPCSENAPGATGPPHQRAAGLSLGQGLRARTSTRSHPSAPPTRYLYGLVLAAHSAPERGRRRQAQTKPSVPSAALRAEGTSHTRP
ncbi:hypothetical protein NDU88_003275 [Pleurodeles waltl]|uniref:Uncharacterized protein n=1 Tax=Pleurodeles waltl TaxID=8319 RepID=A0AAV7UDL1_PLEWA|nr:hypothetical protein NDU88_003275 [Pleurodeles waltl]